MKGEASMATRTISNSDDTIDSRDVIERIEELEAEREAITEEVEEYAHAEEEEDDDGNPKQVDVDRLREARESLKEWDDENGDELKALKALAKEASGYADDWKYGAQLIRDSYFTEAMQELLDDCGEIPKNFPSYIEIDWEATARNLRADYTSVEFDGVTYWVR
jgi:hypothetical protein